MLCAIAVIGVMIVTLSVWVATAAGASGDWGSYGEDLANSRSQSHPDGIGAATASRLRERFAIRRSGVAHGATPSVTSTPAVDGGVADYGDWQGGLHAVGLADGRLRWTTHVAVQDGPLNSSAAVVGNSVFVSTGDGRVVAVTRRTGKVRWTTVLDTHFASTLYSSPAVAGHTLVVEVSSAQNFFAGPHDFRGSIVALDTRNGRILWRTFVVRPDVDGTGGSVWSSASIARCRVYRHRSGLRASARPAQRCTARPADKGRIGGVEAAVHRRRRLDRVRAAWRQGLRHRRRPERVPDRHPSCDRRWRQGGALRDPRPRRRPHDLAGGHCAAAATSAA
jgi:outer membrane protein assembly factor BamB